MRRTSFCLCVCASGVFHPNYVAADDRGPLLASPVTESDAEIIALEEGVDPVEIRKSIIEGNLRAVYRDSDVQSLFPEIGVGEERAFHCEVSVASPPSMTFAYVKEDATANKVVVKSIHCKHGTAGAFCSLSLSEAYYWNDPKKFFSIEATSLDEAVQLMALYADSALDREWGPLLAVSKIKKNNGSYELTLGRPDCACIGKAVVAKRSFLWFSWLDILVEPQINCA